MVKLTKVKTTEGLKHIFDKHGICDTWRLKNKKVRDYSYYSPHFKVFTSIDYILTDYNTTAAVDSCNINPMLWMDHAWLECHLCTSAGKETCRQWTFNNKKTLLLSDINRQQLTPEIEDYFKINYSGETHASITWNAMKAVLKGRIIALSTALERDHKKGKLK